MIGASKLTREMVAEIKNLFKTTTLNDAEIADVYNVSRIHINKIRNGQRWNNEQHSFIMKKELEEKLDHIKNYIILRLLDETTGDVILANQITTDELMPLRNYITECFINQTGGTTIVLEIVV